MEKILLLGFAEAGQTADKQLLEAAAAASKLASDLNTTWDIALAGKEIQTAANSLAGSGAAHFFGVEGDDFESARYASDLLAVEALVKKSEATLVIVPGTSRANRVVSALSARLNGRADTHLTGIAVRDGIVTVRMPACSVAEIRLKV